MKTRLAFTAGVVFFFASLPVFAAPVVEPGLELIPEPELRLRLSDPQQARKTTSLNWVDLKAEAPVPPGAALAEPEEPALKILIDPGHGGEDLGAVGFGGVQEKEIALRLSRLVRQQIQSEARRENVRTEVRLTREEDRFIPLRERPEIANTWDADLFVSIHLNSSPSPKVRGFEVYFLNSRSSDAEASRVAKAENAGHAAPAKTDVWSILNDVQTNQHIAESARFAEAIYGVMAQDLLPNKRGVRQAPFAVLSGTKMPALLIEVGYLTHEGETDNLKRGLYLKRVAGAISSGILRFATGRKKAVEPESTHAIRRQAAG
jgi:N-acetylmuramoyl-L-alanine amidase